MADAALIAALQLADSFFPSGMVTLSHGLEAFISQQPASETDMTVATGGSYVLSNLKFLINDIIDS